MALGITPATQTHKKRYRLRLPRTHPQHLHRLPAGDRCPGTATRGQSVYGQTLS